MRDTGARSGEWDGMMNGRASRGTSRWLDNLHGDARRSYGDSGALLASSLGHAAKVGRKGAGDHESHGKRQAHHEHHPHTASA